MAEPLLQVAETFTSIQGESSYAGCPCFFIRLAGCNLNCRYCDTGYARAGGQPESVAELAARALASGLSLVEVTGGEPLMQPATPLLLRRLAENGNEILLETNGSFDISGLPDAVSVIMDIKCPGSGVGDVTVWENIERLRPRDEVKFVLLDRADYEWALDVARRHDLAARCAAVLLSPVWNRLPAVMLARWILEDRAPVRLNAVLHKWLWGAEARGV